MINNYLNAIGGTERLRRMLSHTILCHNIAKGIRQSVKEFYNYQTKAFKLEVTIDESIIMVMEGDEASGAKTISNKTVAMSAEEVLDTHQAIHLVPEIFFHDDLELNNRVLKDTYTDSGLNWMNFSYGAYQYKMGFDPESHLKAKYYIVHKDFQNHGLDMNFSDWHEINGILIPYRIDMSNPNMDSYKQIESVEIEFI